MVEKKANPKFQHKDPTMAEQKMDSKAKLKATCFQAFEKIFEDLYSAAEAEGSLKSSKDSSPRSDSESTAASPLTPKTSDSEATTEIEYNYAYSISLFSEVAGYGFKNRDGIYVQTYGGGPEGGYVFGVDDCVYKVHREWFQPFTMKRVNPHRFVQSLEKGYDALRFRSLPAGDSMAETEKSFDFKEFREIHQIIWQQATSNVLEPLSETSSSSSSSCSSSSSSSSSSSGCSFSSSSSDESVCDAQHQFNIHTAKAYEVYEFLKEMKCHKCDKVKF